MPLDPSASSGQTLAAALRRYLIQQFPVDRDYDRAALHADAMPPLVAAFLDHMLDRWTAMERDRLRSDWFDFEQAEVQKAEAQFFTVLGRTARVPMSAWEATLGGAVDLVVRFLTTPARALTDAIFEGEADPLPAETVRERLELFAAYPYLAQAARAYLNQAHLGAVDPDALFHVLDRADRRAVQGYDPEKWLTLLHPLFDLAGQVPELGGVPSSVLRDFFEAKGEETLAERLDSIAGTVLDEAMLRDLMETGDDGQRTEGRGQKTESEVTGSEELRAEEEAIEEVPVPLWQRFTQEGGGDGSVNARFGAADEKGEGISPLESPPSEEKVPLWQHLTPPLPPPALPAPESPVQRPGALEELEERVLGRISPGQRTRFVKHLFRGDAGKYATVLHALDAATSWTEASQVIARDVFRPFRVNIYGEHAVAFTDAVEARFRK